MKDDTLSLTSQQSDRTISSDPSFVYRDLQNWRYCFYRY